MKKKIFMHSFNPLLFLLVCAMGTSCAGLLQNRTFIDEMDQETDGFFVAGRDFNTVAGDSGTAYRTNEQIRNRTPASKSEAYSFAQNKALHQELARKERGLNPRQRELYNQALPYLETTSEKIYFLSLTFYEQRDYLTARQIPVEGVSSRENITRSMASLQPLYERTLNLGMSKDQVVNLWGRPAKVEVAGDPQNQNERWAFYENGRVKFVYFEAGQVEGWNIH